MIISVLLQLNLFLFSVLSKNVQNHYQNRIIDGDNADRGQAPYLVSVQNWQGTYDGENVWQHICGGAIICTNTILTAGHCLLGKNVTHLRIKAGIKYLTEAGQRISVKSYKIHKKFNTKTFFNQDIDHVSYFDEMYSHEMACPDVPAKHLLDYFGILCFYVEGAGNFISLERWESLGYDIGLIQLETPLFYNKYVSPILLPQTNSTSVSGTALLAGWGSISPFVSEEYTIMQFAYVPIIDHDECIEYIDYTAKEINNSNVYISDYQVCAGSLNGGVSACNGDSGGPLAQNNVTIGIVSWTIQPCGRANVSTIYTGTAYFIEWIRQNINSSECTLKYG